MRCRTAVASSFAVYMKPPSPLIASTGPSGRAWVGGGEAGLGDLVDPDAVVGQFGPDDVQKGELRADLFLKALAQSGMPILHLRLARRTADIGAAKLVD